MFSSFLQYSAIAIGAPRPWRNCSVLCLFKMFLEGFKQVDERPLLHARPWCQIAFLLPLFASFAARSQCACSTHGKNSSRLGLPSSDQLQNSNTLDSSSEKTNRSWSIETEVDMASMVAQLCNLTENRPWKRNRKEKRKRDFEGNLCSEIGSDQ